MSIYTFQMSYKLSRKQLNIIIKNLQLYCDEIKCDKFDIYLNEIERKNLYLLDIELYNEIDDENDNVIKLVEFYLDAFNSGNDEKIF